MLYKYVDENINLYNNNARKLNKIMPNNLTTEKKVQAISMLAEGSSIRSIERITGVHRDTIMRLAVRVGEGCAKMMDTKLRGLGATEIEVDEIWGFIGAKQKNAQRTGDYGDVWTFIGIDPDSKLIPSFVVGKRDAYHANTFMADLASRLTNSRANLHRCAGGLPRSRGKGFWRRCGLCANRKNILSHPPW